MFGSKMGKPRKGWREKDANDHCNNHTDNQCKRFFKVLIGDFRKRLVSNFFCARSLPVELLPAQKWGNL
jgi:hypothetical protein